MQQIDVMFCSNVLSDPVNENYSCQELTCKISNTHTKKIIFYCLNYKLFCNINKILLRCHR
jgi:hypothetical protein